MGVLSLQYVSLSLSMMIQSTLLSTLTVLTLYTWMRCVGARLIQQTIKVSPAPGSISYYTEDPLYDVTIQPRDDHLDSYGSPVGPPVPQIDSYGSPIAPPTGQYEYDNYGAPLAPAVDYGSPVTLPPVVTEEPEVNTQFQLLGLLCLAFFLLPTTLEVDSGDTEDLTDNILIIGDRDTRDRDQDTRIKTKRYHRRKIHRKYNKSKPAKNVSKDELFGLENIDRGEEKYSQDCSLVEASLLTRLVEMFFGSNTACVLSQ